MIGPKHLITIVAGLIMCYNSVAQVNPAYFTQLTYMDGLPSNTVGTIYQDHQGFIWFLTRYGVSKYDGIEFEHYIYSNNEDLESSSFVLEDSLGNLWFDRSLIMLDRYGVFRGFRNLRFDYSRGGFSNLWGIQSAQTGPDHNLYLAAPRNIWIANPYDPAYRLDSIFQDQNALPFDYITKIAFDLNNNLWIGTSNGLYIYESEKDSVFLFEPLQYSNVIRDFLFDSDGNLWIACNHELVEYNFKLQSSTYHQIPSKEINILSRVFQSSEGIILLGTNRGLYYLEPGKTLKESPLTHIHVLDIFEDRSNHLWIGTENYGIYKVNRLPNAFNHLSLNIGDQNTSFSNQSQLLANGNKGLWINEISRGLFYHEFSTRQTYLIDASKQINGIVFQEPEQHLWYTTAENLVRYNLQDASIHKYPLPPTGNSPGIYSEVHCVDICKYRNSLILGTSNRGIYSFNPDNEEYTLIIKTEAPLNDITSRHNKLWVGTQVEIFTIDSLYHVIDTIRYSDSFNLPKNAGQVLFIDSYDTLWIGSEGGFCKRNLQLGRIEWCAFDFMNLNISIKQILEDNEGNLWIGSDKGIYMYDRTRASLTLLKSRHGFPVYNMSVQSSAQTPDGRMFFGSKVGIIYFQPDEVPLNTHVPEILITGFETLHEKERIKKRIQEEFHSMIIQGQEIQLEHFHSTKIVKIGQEIHLKYWQNSFTVKYASLNFIDPRQNQYQYRLAGLEDEWNKVGNQSRATYTSLRKGDYTFEVTGSNNEGVWNKEPFQLFIHLDPPPWWSWWSITLYVFIFLGILFAIILTITRRLRLQHQLELKSKESENLLEINQAKSQFFTNISHEFRTPLSLILDPAEQLVNDKQITPKHKRFAKLILNNSKRLLFLTNQILDLAKLDNKRIKLKVEETDLRELVNSTAQAFKSGAKSRGLEYRILLPDKPVLAWIDGERIEQVVVNLLSNAFKFCSLGEIAIELLEMDDSVWIHVRDTGIGISADQIDHIFDNYYQVERDETKNMAGTGIGLYLAKQLVTLHQGIVQVKSEVNNGSTFSVCLRKGKNHFLPGQLTEDSRPEEEETKHADKLYHPTKESDKIIPKNINPSLLIIEDNPDMMQYLADVLSEEYSILKAKDGEEGFRRALEMNPDVVISDVMMPVLDGYAFCDKVKKDKRTSHIPVILLTAKTMHKDKINGLQLGADDYLQKPFHLDELKLRIRYHLELRKKIQEEFLRHFKISSETELALSVKDKLLQDVFSHIEEHLLDEQFGVDKLSKLAGMSRGHLNNKIKSLTNQTTNELIRSFRLRKAAYLLSKKGLTVSEACYQAGFNNPSYFSKCFADFYGTRPSEFYK